MASYLNRLKYNKAGIATTIAPKIKHATAIPSELVPFPSPEPPERSADSEEPIDPPVRSDPDPESSAAERLLDVVIVGDEVCGTIDCPALGAGVGGKGAFPPPDDDEDLLLSPDT